MPRQSARESRVVEHRDRAVRLAAAAASASCDASTDGAKPSRRSTVAASALSKLRRRGRDVVGQMRGAGHIARRAHRRRHARGRVRVVEAADSDVASVSACGSTLTVTSVIAASVPHEPASSLHRS